MFKLSFTLSALLATTQAFSNQGNLLAQSGSNCCCSVMPCQDQCQKPCIHNPRPIPAVMIDWPEPIQEVMLDADVIIQHIFREIKPTIKPGPLPPLPTPADESEYIQTVLTPLIMRVMAEDIVPELPLCITPGGDSFYLNDAPDPNPASTIVDPTVLMTNVLEQAIADLTISGGGADSHLGTVLADLDAASIMEGLIIKDKNGEHAVEVIIAGQKTIAEGQHTSEYGQGGGDTFAIDSDLSDELATNIKDMVIEQTDDAKIDLEAFAAEPLVLEATATTVTTDETTDAIPEVTTDETNVAIPEVTTDETTDAVPEENTVVVPEENTDVVPEDQSPIFPPESSTDVVPRPN